MNKKTPYAIYQRGELYYLGLHDSEADCWRVALGWPGPEEIQYAKNVDAMICLKVRVQALSAGGEG